MRRRDWELIKALHAHRSKETLEEYLRLPFIEVEYFYGEINEELYEGIRTVQDVINIFPFNDFVVALRKESSHYVYRFSFTSDQDTKAHWRNFKYSISYYMDSTIPEFEGYEVRINVSYDKATDRLVFNPETSIPDYPKIDEEKISLPFIELIKYDYANLVRFFAEVESRDKYPVRVRQKTTKQDKKSYKRKPWLCTNHPRILFLNRLPIEADPSGDSGSNQGAKDKHARSGHMRRGHWRRLNHERFRHHPQFGSRIRVKPSWVGPTNTEFQGATYTLWKPTTTPPS